MCIFFYVILFILFYLQSYIISRKIIKVKREDSISILRKNFTIHLDKMAKDINAMSSFILVRKFKFPQDRE